MRLWLSIAGLVLLADQATKWLVLQTMPLGEVIPITGFFNLVHVRNPGAAFSFLADAGGWQRWLFAFFAIGVSAVLIVMIRKAPDQRLFCLAAALIIGGAIGNLIDRLVFGEVIDFLDFFWNQWHWPAFNLADSAITIGAVVMILDELVRWRRQPEIPA
ncbi:MAG: lipoprotein signal peptidase [Betaproteobacteria bacterium]|nr:lipoprotein signal peptidase [Betaproteobacteria bacterium]